MSNSRFWITLVVLAVLGLSAVLVFRVWANRQLEAQNLTYARAALEAQNFVEAEKFAAAVLRRRPASTEAALIAGEAAVALARLDAALQYFGPLLDGVGSDTEIALAAIGDIYFQRGQASRAEPLLRRALELNPHQDFARRRLVFLLNLQGRHWEAQPLQFELVREDRFLLEDLMLLAQPETDVPLDDLKRFQAGEPENAATLTGEARRLIRQQQWDEAEKLLRSVLARQPGLVEAQAALGALLMQRADSPEMLRWLASLGPPADEHPDVWVVRGMWAQRRGQTQAAARCLWEALRRAPNHRVASYQLSIALNSLGDSVDAAALQRRAELLGVLHDAVDGLLVAPGNLESLQKAANSTASLGRYWESLGWHRVALLQEPTLNWAHAGRRQLEQLVAQNSSQVAADQDPGKRLNLTSFPLPDMTAAEATTVAGTPPPSPAHVHFADVTSESGVAFQYFNADDPLTEGRLMFEFTGGGVGIIDYDQDGWPDIYLPQGCRWPPQPEQLEFTDRLFRNLGNGRFVDVTETALLGDNGFSQGVAVGDYDNDGFPDLYVANVGENRLYQNCGDGTFRDVTVAAGVQGARWTTSCLIADLNGDGRPDLYEVNYVQGKNVYDMICTRDGKSRACTPQEFDAQEDRFFLNLGEGPFEDRTAAAGFVAPDGKGLGLVAGDFDGSGRLSLFVANDTTANFFFQNQGTPGGEPKFAENGLLIGLGLDRDGRPQACMGIAADDFDNDGRLDLFVTNFYQEHNTFYHQRSDGLFWDESRERGLAESSLKFLGFGTQAIDADLDGDGDLVVANGHIDDFTYKGIPFQMPPQLFRNHAGAFTDLPGNTIGSYFERQMLGRGMAKFDFNRDGREDFVVSHLDVPVAVVENQSSPCGNHLALKLHGRTTARDALGTIAVLEAGGRRWTKQLTGGNGYMASNERKLVFGLGDVTTVDQLTVRWPSGQVQVWSQLGVNQELELVEGAVAPVVAVRDDFTGDSSP